MLVVCFTLNFQSIKGAAAVAQSVKDQRPEMRFLPVPMRIDAGEEKSLNRMKSYAAEVFTPFLDLSINQEEYWFSMEVPYHPRYAYAEKLALFEEQASITASTLPAMVRLTRYVTVGEVQTAGPLPDTERRLVLAEFEGVEAPKGRLRPHRRNRNRLLAPYWPPTGRDTSTRRTSAGRTSAGAASSRRTSAGRTSARWTSARQTSARRTSPRPTSAGRTSARRTSLGRTSARRTSARRTCTGLTSDGRTSVERT